VFGDIVKMHIATVADCSCPLGSNGCVMTAYTYALYFSFLKK